MADNMQDRVVKGQALNLAVAAAIHEGKAMDVQTVLKNFLHFHNIIDSVQKVSIEDIRSIVSGDEAPADDE